MRRAEALIPQPARIEVLGGLLKIGRPELKIDPLLRNPAVAQLASAFASSASAQTPVEMGRVRGLHPQGYRLEIGDTLRLHASTAQGAFYGIQTLLQLYDPRTRTIEKLRIDDRPVLERRGMHLDLKTQLHRLDYLEGFVEWLAAHKINCILLEYEDKIRYRKHRVISHRCAMMKEEVRRLVRVAERHFIEVIPLQQTLGHLEYVGRHPEYAKYMEWNCRELTAGGVSDQLCPCEPASLRLLEELLGETADMFRRSRFYHVGGDETRRLGLCMKCRERAKQGGVEALYLEHMDRVFALVKKMGKTPIVWGDMYIHFPDILSRVPKDVIIADWDYWSTSLDRAGHVADWRWGTSLTPALVTKLPREEMRRWERYIRGRDYPQHFRGFPFQRFFRDQGLRVMAVPSVRRAGDSYHFPDNDEHVPNVITCAKATSSLDRNEGMVMSSWAVRRSPWENTKFAILAGADAAWNPREASQASHDRRFPLHFFGEDSRNYSRLCYLLGRRAFRPPQYASAGSKELAAVERDYGRAAKILAEHPGAAPQNARAFRHLRLAAKQCAFDAALARLWLGVHDLWSGPRPISMRQRGRIIRDVRTETHRLWEALRRLRAETRKLYRQTIVAREVEADLRIRYGPAGDILRRLRRIVL